jgi:hypothetical protein
MLKILAKCVVSPRVTRLIEDPAGDWRRLDERLGCGMRVAH